MAEKKPLIETNLFAKTDIPKTQAKSDKTNPLGVLLEPGEIKQLDKLAADLGVSRHALLQYTIRQFLADCKKGKLPEMGTKTTKVLRIK